MPTPTETVTRQELIDPALKKAGWDVTNRDQAGRQTEVEKLKAELAPLQRQLDQLTRQFWVSKQAVVANKYDLSASRYRQIEPDEVYYEQPQVTMERLLILERVMAEEVRQLTHLMGEAHDENTR